MDESAFYVDPPRQILQLMKDTYGDRFNSYYLGAPTIDFPNSAYPVCVVQSVQSSNTIEDAPTSTDTVSEMIHVYFLEQSQDFENQSDDVDTAHRVLYQKIQGRDPATGFYLAGTAMYALRSNLTLKSANTGFQTTIDHDIQIDYDSIPRPDRPMVIEALITVVTRERVIVPNRS